MAPGRIEKQINKLFREYNRFLALKQSDQDQDNRQAEQDILGCRLGDLLDLAPLNAQGGEDDHVADQYQQNEKYQAGKSFLPESCQEKEKGA